MRHCLRVLICLLCSSLPCRAVEGPPVAELVRDHTEFATSLYDTINSPSNIVFSPYSIATTLSMVLLGGRNETADEIQKTLHLTIDRDQIATTTQALIQQLQSQNGDQLKVANAIWADQTTFLLSHYRHIVESAFKGKIDRTNFQKPDQAAATINQWISDQTGGKITNLFQQADLDEYTRLVVTNGVYFQGNFASPFNAKQTEDAPFHPTPDTTSSMPMMEQIGSFPYLENTLFQMLCIPFVSKNETSMALAILLPRSTDNLPQIENDLGYSFDEWISSLHSKKIALQLPKFGLKKRLNLNGILQQMGMKISFLPEANFSGINGALDLYLSQVIHEAFFTLSETGVVATAATAANMSVKSAPDNSTPISFIADHPFLFLIVDMASHEILFMGKFQEPKDVL